MPKFENIASYHLGNGLSVCDKSKEVNGDYKKVAHIDIYRQVTFYGRVKPEVKEHVLNIARTDNGNISATQEQKIFKTEPNEKYIYVQEGKIYKPALPKK